MTPLPVHACWIVIPAHLGLVLRWESPRTLARAKHAPYCLAPEPVPALN